MVYSNYVKQRILHLRRTGKSYSQIADHLASEGHYVTEPGISYFLKTYKETGSIARKPGSGGKGKKSRALLDLIYSQIEKDDEISLFDLQSQLEQKGVKVSVTTIHRWKEELSWTPPWKASY